jgi:hypothetical protein
VHQPDLQRAREVVGPLPRTDVLGSTGVEPLSGQPIAVQGCNAIEEGVPLLDGQRDPCRRQARVRCPGPRRPRVGGGAGAGQRRLLPTRESDIRPRNGASRSGTLGPAPIVGGCCRTVSSRCSTLADGLTKRPSSTSPMVHSSMSSFGVAGTACCVRGGDGWECVDS